MTINDQVKKEIRIHAKERFPEECCGFIIQHNHRPVIVRCKNVAENPLEDYRISPQTYLQAKSIGPILACYHSHPMDTDVSLLDKMVSEHERLPSIVYSFAIDDFLIYQPEDYKNPYIGKKFSLGKNDCLTLALDYYNNELGLSLKDFYPNREGNDFFEREHAVWKDQRYLENIIESDFKLVIKGEPKLEELKKHDCILTKFYNSEHPSHLLIYIGGGKVLHQPRNGYSRIEEYSEYFRHKTYGVARHKSFYEQVG